MSRMKSLSLPAKTVAGFGVMTILMGLTGLLSPQTLLDILGFPFDLAQTRTFMMASSQASIAVGSYYLLSAFQENRGFFAATCYIRLVNTLVFSAMVITGAAPLGWLMVAAYEVLGAAVTTVAFQYEKQRVAK